MVKSSVSLDTVFGSVQVSVHYSLFATLGLLSIRFSVFSAYFRTLVLSCFSPWSVLSSWLVTCRICYSSFWWCWWYIRQMLSSSSIWMLDYISYLSLIMDSDQRLRSSLTWNLFQLMFFLVFLASAFAAGFPIKAITELWSDEPAWTLFVITTMSKMSDLALAFLG